MKVIRPLHVGLASAVVCVLAVGCTGQIVGSGHVVTKIVPVSAFDRLEVGSAFEVRVSVGSAPGLTLHVDDNLLARVDAGVSGHTLRIKLEPGLSLGESTLKADVTTTGLSVVQADGASRVVLQGELSATNLVMKLSGASQVDGSVRAQAVTFQVSGASRARVRGSSTRLTIDGSGASELDLESLQASSLDANLSGVSQARVSVSETMSVDLSGASRLSYRGTPTITRQQVSGGSQLEQI